MRLNFFGKVTLGAVGVVGAAVAIMFIFGGGDVEAVEARIAEGEAALNAHDGEACIAFIDPAYDSDGMGYDSVTSMIRGNVLSTSYSSVKFETVEIDVVGETATVALKMRFKGGAMGNNPYPLSFTFSLRRREGVWRIVSIKLPQGLDR